MSKLRLAANGLVALGLALAIAAPFVVSWNALKLAFIPAELYSRFRLLVSDSVNPNVMAGALVLLLPLAAGLLLFALRELAGWERLLAGLFLLCGVGMLFLTQSRGAWLALAAALSVLLVLRSRWGWLLILGFLAVGLFLALRLGLTQTAGLLVSSPTLGGLEGRLEVWSRALYMLQDFPFTGIGMGAFTEVADRLYPFFLYAPGTVEHAHNLFLQVGVDLGWLGLIAWLGLLLGTLVCAWKSLRLAQKGGALWRAGLSAGLLAAQIALIVHGLTDAVTWGMVRSAPLVWCTWGLAVAAFLTVPDPQKSFNTELEIDAPSVE